MKGGLEGEGYEEEIYRGIDTKVDTKGYRFRKNEGRRFSEKPAHKPAYI